MRYFSLPPTPPNEKEIFIDDVDKLVMQTYPDHEGQHPLFKKFGTRTGGFTDAWVRTQDWQNLPEVEKWKYVALCSLYWQEVYQYRLKYMEACKDS